MPIGSNPLSGEEDDDICFVCEQKLEQYILIHRKTILDTTKVERWCLACVYYEGLKENTSNELKGNKDTATVHGTKSDVLKDNKDWQVSSPPKNYIIRDGVAMPKEINIPDGLIEDYRLYENGIVDPNPNNAKVAVTPDEINNRLAARLFKDLWSGGRFIGPVMAKNKDKLEYTDNQCKCDYCEAMKNRIIGRFMGPITAKNGDPVRVDIGPERFGNDDYDKLKMFWDGLEVGNEDPA